MQKQSTVTWSGNTYEYETSDWWDQYRAGHPVTRTIGTFVEWFKAQYSFCTTEIEVLKNLVQSLPMPYLIDELIYTPELHYVFCAVTYASMPDLYAEYAQHLKTIGRTLSTLEWIVFWEQNVDLLYRMLELI